MIPLLFYQLQEGRMTMTVRELLVSKQISMRNVDFIAIVSDDGVVLNSADQQPVWFGMHQLSEEYMDKQEKKMKVLSFFGIKGGIAYAKKVIM